MATLQMEATLREGRGKNRARQLRRQGQVPAVVYGGREEPLAVSVDPRQVAKILHSEAGQNAVFSLQVKGRGKTNAMIRDWQLDPVKELLLHVDLQRIAMDERLKVRVPVHVKGEAKGVKVQGGILDVVNREVEVECLPGDIPDEFVVDVSELEINRAVRVEDLRVDPSKVKVLADPEWVLVHVLPPRVEEEEKPPEEAVPAEGAEPELVGKREGKPEEEAEQEEAPEGGRQPEKGEKK